MKELENSEEKGKHVKKPSAIIDLDVLTVAHWKGDQKPEADKLLAKVAAKEFYTVTPFILVELLMSWNDKNLVQRIEDFYSENTDLWLSERKVKEQTEALSINLTELITKLEKKGVKQEDSVLVVIAALFKIDYLITFNRKHLLSKKEVINDALGAAGLQQIRIASPRELASKENDGSKSDASKTGTKRQLSSLSLLRNLADIPFFISSANSTGSMFSGIIALAFHFLSFTKSSMRHLSPIRIYKPFAQGVSAD